MKAFAIVKNGSPEKAFKLMEFPDPVPQSHEVVIEVESFGLNFADVMARLGLYRDCPPLPAVVGYEVVGKVKGFGQGVSQFNEGQRVVAFTRFGGYATQVATDQRAVVPIPDDMEAGEAAALAVQYSTAYFAAEEMVRLHEGDHVLIQAAAGGVGTALIQLAKHRKCVIYGAAGSDEKLEYLKKQGVDYPINYREADFYESVKAIMGDNRPDVIFNSLGGKSVRDGINLLSPGGRIVCYGAAETADGGNKLLANLKLAVGFGLQFTPFLIMQSKSVIGINMLTLSDARPEVLERCLKSVVKGHQEGYLKPTVGGVYQADELGQAHAFLESRKSMGKIIVNW